MRRERLVWRTRIEAPTEEVFLWHTRRGAFERLTPPWEQVEVVEKFGGIKDGDRVTFLARIGPFKQRWVAEHSGYEEGRQFKDRQVVGPFAYWEHLHRFLSAGPQASFLEDSIEYSLPLGFLGRLVAGSFVRSKLERVFDYRHEITRQDIETHREFTGGRQMKILVSGSNGLIGSDLVPFLNTGGHDVWHLTRKSGLDSNEINWEPEHGNIYGCKLEGFDAVVHLAGENIAVGKWTEKKKRLIRESRVRGTRLLCETLSRLKRPPRVLVCASAIGFYGDRGNEMVREEDGQGQGFLADVCKAWEEATRPAIEKGIRVVHLRFGMVLSPKGGALQKMLLPFRLGLGGRLGSGKQYMSWISIDDAIKAIYFSICNESVIGPTNLVSPNPVTNREFTKILGRVLSRPTIFRVPAFAARLLFGEMADPLLLTGARVFPGKLLSKGFEFQHPGLEDTLRFLLGCLLKSYHPILTKHSVS